MRSGSAALISAATARRQYVDPGGAPAEIHAEELERLEKLAARCEERLNLIHSREVMLWNRSKTINALTSYNHFKLIRACLHSDRLTSVDSARLNKAFDIFNKLEGKIDLKTPIADLHDKG